MRFHVKYLSIIMLSITFYSKGITIFYGDFWSFLFLIHYFVFFFKYFECNIKTIISFCEQLYIIKQTTRITVNLTVYKLKKKNSQEYIGKS